MSYDSLFTKKKIIELKEIESVELNKVSMINSDTHEVELYSLYDECNFVDQGPNGNSEACIQIKTKERILTFYAKKEKDSFTI